MPGETQIVEARSPSRSFRPVEPKEMGLRDIIYEHRGEQAWLILNRPKSYNAYTVETLEELTRAVLNAANDDRVGVIVLTGHGTRAFSTGGDVHGFVRDYVERPRDYWKYMGAFQAAVEALLRCGKPTIARINGMAVGGGNELHLACDLSVAADHAYLGQVGVAVGSVACGGATQWLPLAVGDRRAREMLMLNEKVPAKKAGEWGLVNRVVPSVKFAGQFVTDPAPAAVEKAQKREDGYSIDLTALDAAVGEFSTRLLSMFPECLRYTKTQTNFWKELAWSQTIPHARDWLALHFASFEPYEGMTAFTEKRGARVPELRRRLAEGGSGEFVHGPPTRACRDCGSKGLPAGFGFCGKCGKKL